jgi:hypothetical protein
MRLTLVAPLWDHGDAETHTYECSCCKHRQAFKLSIKQYAAAVAGPKSAVQIHGGSRDRRTVGMAGRAVGHGFARSAEANGEIGTLAGSVRIAGQRPDMLDRSLEIEFESFRKSLSTDKARHAFDERIERLLCRHGVDYVRGYVDALEDAPL